MQVNVETQMLYIVSSKRTSRLPIYAKYTPKMFACLLSFFCGFFQSPTADTPAHTFLLLLLLLSEHLYSALSLKISSALSTSNDVVPRKEVPFGG